MSDLFRKANGLRAEKKDKILVLSFDVDQFSFINAQDVLKGIKRFLDEDSKIEFVILDMDNLQKIDSSAVGAMITLINNLGKENLYLINCNTDILRTMHILNIKSFFNIRDNLREAENSIDSL